MESKKAIGIIGGMGPLATADLFQKIILHTRASCDQEHLRVYIDSNTNIPDRTAALLHGGADPTPELVSSARGLERQGAELLIMPCNTAHNFYDGGQSAVSVPVLHMIRLTAQALAGRGVKTAGLLATDGTIQTGIYQRTFAGTGVELLVPAEEGQRAVMDMIYQGVKAGKRDYNAAAARRAMESLMERGAETLILGCTELPLAVELYGLVFPVTDPTLELALGAIRAAGGEIAFADGMRSAG
ncbi:MAG: amino acid racemase [Oscillospiraceae bacterium]|nr:amino acid racemase [Oscillospiraceae bacterium]